jgi:hypothetical protein
MTDPAGRGGTLAVEAPSEKINGRLIERGEEGASRQLPFLRRLLAISDGN